MQPLFGKYLHGDMDYYAMLMSQRAGILNEQPLVTGRERSEREVYADHSTGPTGDVYGKGSLVLHSLRELIGDAAFYESVRRLLYGRPDPKPGNFSGHFATSEDFIEIINRVTHQDLRWFFQVYLYRAALPQLIAERDGNLLKLLWRTPDDLPFPMPVEVRLGEHIVTVPMASGRGELELEPNADLTLDPHSKLLRQSDAIDQFRAWKAVQPK
jgi:aminopeptidase N